MFSADYISLHGLWYLRGQKARDARGQCAVALYYWHGIQFVGQRKGVAVTDGPTLFPRSLSGRPLRAPERTRCRHQVGPIGDSGGTLDCRPRTALKDHQMVS